MDTKINGDEGITSHDSVTPILEDRRERIIDELQRAWERFLGEELWDEAA
jgi:hypothetical protein